MVRILRLMPPFKPCEIDRLSRNMAYVLQTFPVMSPLAVLQLSSIDE